MRQIQALRRAHSKHLTQQTLPQDHSIQVFLNLLVPPLAKQADLISLLTSIWQSQGRIITPREFEFGCEF